MGAFQGHAAGLEGLLLVAPKVYSDPRGYFLETYHAGDYAQLGILEPFVQDNQSYSRRGTLRGLHFQRRRPQGKLVRAAYGEIFDVAVDIRPESRTFGHWFGKRLSDQNHLQLYIPDGFAHGFYTLSESAVVCYKCTEYYDPSDQWGIRWDDPTLDITWPLHKGIQMIISERDHGWPSWKAFTEAGGQEV